MSEVHIESLFKAGAHYGHLVQYWNPKMAHFIYGSKKRVHIINLERTLEQLDIAGQFVKDLVLNGNTILFVGTKPAASEITKASALEAGQPYVSRRWLGGLLTNFKTIRNTISRLDELEGQRESGYFQKITKKEALLKEREIEKLLKFIGGVRKMTSLPEALFVVDIVREKNAIKEARKLGIPIIGIVDTNCDPEQVDIPIPGNDDSSKAIELYFRSLVDAALLAKHEIKTGDKQKTQDFEVREASQQDASDFEQSGIEDSNTQADNSQEEN